MSSKTLQKSLDYVKQKRPEPASEIWKSDSHLNHWVWVSSLFSCSECSEINPNLKLIWVRVWLLAVIAMGLSRVKPMWVGVGLSISMLVSTVSTVKTERPWSWSRTFKKRRLSRSSPQLFRKWITSPRHFLPTALASDCRKVAHDFTSWPWTRANATSSMALRRGRCGWRQVPHAHMVRYGMVVYESDISSRLYDLTWRDSWQDVTSLVIL